MKSPLLTCCLAVALAASAVEIDGVAARVGSDAILRSDVMIEMRRGNQPPERYAEVLAEMIERKLILKAAGESKMTMQEWVVESRVREVIQRSFDGDRNKLMATLARDKVSYPEWYQHMREDLIVGAMRYQVVDKNVSASPADLLREYKAHPERYADGAKVSVAVILLKASEMLRQGEIDAAIKAGKPFAELAKSYSSDPHAAEGGLWKDVVAKEMFSEEVCAAIDRLAVGEVSNWISKDGWSYLLKKEAEKPGRPRAFEEAFDDVEAAVKEAAAKRLYTEWISRLKEETYVKVF